jgi:hypothetical protein
MVADINLFKYTSFFPNIVCHMFGTSNYYYYYRQFFRVEFGQPT